MQLSPIEKCLLTGAWDVSIPSAPTADLAKLAVEADFRAVLTSPEAKNIF
jgi:hypothetical protein